MRYKQLIALGFSLGIILFLSAFFAPQQKHQAKNLKVLPKDISHETLDEIMDNFKVALGVKCSYSHASRKDGLKKLDFASDEKP